MDANKIVIKFLATLSGFLKVSDDMVLHLPAGQMISCCGTFPEELVFENNKNKYQVNYKDIIDFYISSHCQILAITKGIDERAEFLAAKDNFEKTMQNYLTNPAIIFKAL